MTTFEVGIIFGDDRGSRIPVRKYQVMRLRGNQTETFYKDLSRLLEEGIKQVTPEPLGIYRDFWIADSTDPVYDDEKNLYRDLVNRTVLKISSDALKAAEAVLSDLMSTDTWKDTLGTGGEDDFAHVDLGCVELKEKVPAPVLLQVGQEVLDRRGEHYTYMGRLVPSEARYTQVAFDRDTNTVRGEESAFIPAEFFSVADYAGQIEVYPAPNAYWRKGNKWFARVKKTRKHETFAPLKKQAVMLVAIELAFERFHTEA